MKIQCDTKIKLNFKIDLSLFLEILNTIIRFILFLFKHNLNSQNLFATTLNSIKFQIKALFTCNTSIVSYFYAVNFDRFSDFVYLRKS
jgi:hypothetical protein